MKWFTWEEVHGDCKKTPETCAWCKFDAEVKKNMKLLSDKIEPKTCGACKEPCGNEWCCMKDEK